VNDPALAELAERVRAAAAGGTRLAIEGGGTKAFVGAAASGERLPVRGLRGIPAYEPTELVITARAGTLLSEVEATLAEAGQCLPFEPPRFAPGGTVGGMVAAGLAGPSRASAGSVRDHVLGVTLLDGRGQLLSFGGQVMKNVAGYDVSRLLAGSMGALGVICEVSLKVLPVPAATLTLRFEFDEATALRRINTWAGQPLPVTASAWWEGMLVLRLAGATAAVQAARGTLGGEPVDAALAAGFWAGLRDQRDEFFVGAEAAAQRGATLWRLSLPSTAPALKLSGEQLVEWGGALRWVCSTTPAPAVREAARAAGGHAMRWRCAAAERADAQAPLAPALAKVHARLFEAFDPHHVFDRARLGVGAA
jgi:glycolate oxidase FAD binding subunit